MKFQCTSCHRIYSRSTQALECRCRIAAIPDDRVTLCPIDGTACRSPGCLSCGGTGLMLKPDLPIQKARQPR
jgi:hypothetical protein